MAVEIHLTAIVQPGAELGEGVSVGPYSIIGPRVRIGDRTRVASSVLIEGETTIGAENRIFHGAALGSVCQDLKYRGERTFVRIGDRNTIREFVTINSATGEGESTVVGNDCLLMAYVHAAHNCVIGDHVVLANAVNLAGHVQVRDFASIGGVTPVHQFVRIGGYAFIGGGSRIPQDVPPYLKVAGNPAQPAGINAIGLRRRGFTVEQRALIKKAYVILYRSGLNTSQALERIAGELPRTPEIETFIDFIGASERGIIR
jgi:UDP-N-acetylglucosamine acyltransferase